ncbi:MAG TPA: hypothetical protein PLR24_05925, partial [Saprospiraceae bacterium]|nr:hypothetical protein [Saprospiraceae bacterium]HQN56753.1 hypothetical protein [Saprospiraceae bacterium]
KKENLLIRNHDDIKFQPSPGFDLLIIPEYTISLLAKDPTFIHLEHAENRSSRPVTKILITCQIAQSRNKYLIVW